jgi:steroid 5-alpha reductase family enzyme
MMQHPYTATLFAILVISVVSWLFSVIKKDVSFVDSLWSLFFLVAAAIFAIDAQPLSGRGALVLSLVAIWALRLSIYITARNWGQPEDYRYQAIRSNNEPGFAFKSLYIVFGLQGVLAWVIALPLFPAITSDSALSIVDVIAAMLWLVGFLFEAVGDYQLSRVVGGASSRRSS